MTRIKKKQLTLGIVLLVTFVAVMMVIFMPIFGGGNALNYLDNLYNSISKGSAYYIPKVEHEVVSMAAAPMTLNLKLQDAATAGQVEQLLVRAGATTEATGETVVVSGDLQRIFSCCLEDAEAAYHNRGEVVVERYSTDAKSVLHAWWRALGAIEKDLNRQKRFDEAQLTHTVQAKTVECAYNYYGIEAQQIKDRWGTVLISLVFYVLYTVWYGYGIMYLFEGLGFELTSH
jgi:hypothetical protein